MSPNKNDSMPETNSFDVLRSLLKNLTLKNTQKKANIQLFRMMSDVLDKLEDDEEPMEALENYEVDEDAIARFTRDFVSDIRKSRA